MPAPLGNDLRERIVSAVQEGASTREVADIYEVAPSTVVKVHQCWRVTGAVGARPMGGDRRSQNLEAHGDVIMEIVRAQPDLTLDEICEKLAARGIRASRSALWRFFDRHELSFKKKRRTPANRNAPTSLRRARRGARNA